MVTIRADIIATSHQVKRKITNSKNKTERQKSFGFLFVILKNFPSKFRRLLGILQFEEGDCILRFGQRDRVLPFLFDLCREQPKGQQ